MLRILFLIDRFFHRIFGFWLKVRDFCLFKFSSPQARHELTVKRFEAQKEYAPGGMIFEKGLFDWEKEAIQTYFPKKGALLVAACGGGREVHPLLKMGYSVTAFDGSKDLVQSAKSYFSKDPNVEIFDETFDHFFQKNQKKFDGVILGWGSFSNLITLEEQNFLFQSLKDCCPKGPILISFYLSKKRNSSYWPHAGFVHQFTSNEMKELIDRNGFFLIAADFSSYPQPFVVIQKR